MKKKKNDSRFPAIVVDSREQNPLHFPPNVVTVSGTLKSGDYSLLGFEDKVAIERKSKADCYHSLGGDRDRFENELRRLTMLDFSAIVVECSLSKFLKQPEFSSMNPRSAVRSLVAWSVKYRVPVCWGDDRLHTSAMVVSLLEFWWKYHQKQKDHEHSTAATT